jgi:membrane protein YdbS with pleckstrin-like domain
LLSIFLGIAITFGYNIALSKKMNKVLKIIVGYILPIIVMPTLYYLIRNSREIFVEQNKLIYFGIIYTVVFIAINITNYVINKNSIKEK